MTTNSRPLTVSGRETMERFAGPLVLVGAALVLGAAIVAQPIVAGALVALALLVAVGFGNPTRLSRLFIGLLLVLLMGYDLIGRGFAYLGVPPLFPGELVLSIGVVAIATGGGLTLVWRSPVVWAYLVFAAWCAARTVPFLGVYDIDALRDSVIWTYGAYAILVAAALLHTGWWRRVPVYYARVLPWLVILMPVVFVASQLADEYLPSLPNTPGAFVPQLKPGDLAVQLAGIGAFLLLGLRERLLGLRARAPEPLLWTSWLVAFVLSATSNRGGMVSVAMALGIVMLLRPSGRWLKVAVPAMILIGLAAAIDLRVPLHERREVSVRQLFANMASVVGIEPERDTNLGATVEWRTQWWGDIIDYTVRGQYRWSGKGFGVNLADDDGYQVSEDRSLRSPHNGHMTILARTGLPGIALWVLLHSVFAGSMLIAHLRARARGHETWARIDLWILAFWTAFMVNASFDVFLEGPMGGIWFWSLMGLGIAALEAQRRGLSWDEEAFE